MDSVSAVTIVATGIIVLGIDVFINKSRDFMPVIKYTAAKRESHSQRRGHLVSQTCSFQYSQDIGLAICELHR